MAAPNPNFQRKARERLKELIDHRETVFVVHYACQSFSQPQAKGSPRIAAIAVRNLSSGETSAFSINEEAELAGRRQGGDDLLADQLERAMLHKYFRFLQQNARMRFVHWNMRDIKFGFAAIEHRYRLLGEKPFVLPEHQRVDLALLVADIYGSDYLPRPLLKSLAERNGPSLAGFLDGAEEPAAFDRGHYAAVLQSTLAKVTIIASVTQRAHDRTLVTDASRWKQNKGRLREYCQSILDDPFRRLLATAAGLASVAGAAFSIVHKFIN